MDILQYTFLQNTVAAWLIAVGIATLTFLVLTVAKRLLIRNIARLAKRTRTQWDDIVEQTLGQTRTFWIFIVAVTVGARLLELGDNARLVVRYAGVFLTVLQVGFWGRALILALIERHIKRERDADPGAATTMAALAIVLQILMWLVLFLMGLQNVGVEVGPLLAGLGVGGIAVALAVQNILGDLFASMSIVLDKPFVVGDFIVVGDMSGNVEHVGLKTTRLRSLSGEQLIISNSDLLSTRIRNFKRMWERRIVFRIGIVYQTDRALVEAIPSMLREIVEAQEQARFDRAHFVAFGPSSLDYEVVYFVKEADYTAYMNTQQAINLAILDRFAESGVEFAYPTQTILVERTEEEQKRTENRLDPV